MSPLVLLRALPLNPKGNTLMIPILWDSDRAAPCLQYPPTPAGILRGAAQLSSMCTRGGWFRLRVGQATKISKRVAWIAVKQQNFRVYNRLGVAQRFKLLHGVPWVVRQYPIAPLI